VFLIKYLIIDFNYY